jgi:DNA-binding Lrp family transcriptional regulator
VFVTVRLVSHADEALRTFERAVQACPEVMEMYEMSGASDYLLRVVAADVASYEAFLRGRLTHIPGVRSFESALALKRVVYRTNLPLRLGVR